MDSIYWYTKCKVIRLLIWVQGIYTMNTKSRIILNSLFGVLLLGLSATVSASPVSGDLFYTIYSGTPNVKKVAFNYDGASSFTLGTKTVIGSTPGADGIAGNPQNSDLLLVGGQGGRINTISKSTGTVHSYVSPVSVFHLEVANPTTVYGSGIPGALAWHTINPDGSLSAGNYVYLSGSNTTITQLITTPSGYYYTSSGAGGGGSFGSLSFTDATHATTTALASLSAAHGGVFDSYSDSIILFGDSHVTQVDLSGNVLSDILMSGMQMDQGTVDGSGHVYAASNNGYLTFIDYTASSLIGDVTSFRSTQFLDSYLDDVAPLVGHGSTSKVPEPGSLILMGIGLIGLGLGRHRKRRSFDQAAV